MNIRERKMKSTVSKNFILEESVSGTESTSARELWLICHRNEIRDIDMEVREHGSFGVHG